MKISRARRGNVSSNTDEKQKRPRGRPKSIDLDQRQADIIEAGTDVFIELGYANTTVDIIAAKCGISKRTFYDFYEAKGDLLSAAIKAKIGSVFYFPEATDGIALDELFGRVFFVDENEAPSPAKRPTVSSKKRMAALVRGPMTPSAVPL